MASKQLLDILEHHGLYNPTSKDQPSGLVFDLENHERELGNHEYKRGLKTGITRYAWWKDGRQEVGTTGKSLLTALAEADKEGG